MESPCNYKGWMGGGGVVVAVGGRNGAIPEIHFSLTGETKLAVDTR